MSVLNVNIIPCLSDNYTYLIHDKSTNKMIAVDPPVVEPITSFLNKSNLNLDFILSTHHHADHVDGNLELKKIYNCKIIGFEEDSRRIPGIDIKLKNKFKLNGNLWTSLIISIAPEVDNFLAIKNSLITLLNI